MVSFGELPENATSKRRTTSRIFSSVNAEVRGLIPPASSDKSKAFGTTGSLAFFNTCLRGYKHALIIKIYTADTVAYGECTAFQGPWYSPETVWTALHIIRDHMAPRVLNQDIKGPEDCYQFIPVFEAIVDAFRLTDILPIMY